MSELVTHTNQWNESGSAVDVAMLGARMHYAVPRMLAATGRLGTFYTDVYLEQDSLMRRVTGLARMLPTPIRPTVANTAGARYCPELDATKVTALNWMGLWPILARQFCGRQSCRDAVNLRTGKVFATHVARLRRRTPAAKVFAFRTAAEEIFIGAKERGQLCVLEQTIAPKVVEARLLSEQNLAWPGWQHAMDLGLVDQMNERERREWALADLIVCGSPFVMDSLVECGVPREKCVVVPYGVDGQAFERTRKSGYCGGRPLRLLFVGEVGLRKGAPILYAALCRLPKDSVECRIVGPVTIRPAASKKLGERAVLVGQVSKSQVRDHLAWADALVLPTVCEGSATVTYEALAAGIPVITTHNCGSIVRHGVEGYVLPVGDVEALASCIERIAGDTAEYQKLAEGAVSAISRATLGQYSAKLIAAIEIARVR